MAIEKTSQEILSEAGKTTQGGKLQFDSQREYDDFLQRVATLLEVCPEVNPDANCLHQCVKPKDHFGVHRCTFNHSWN